MHVLGPQINHVGPVPPSYYVRDHVKVDYERCLTVSRGSSQQLDYEILFPGCVLRSEARGHAGVKGHPRPPPRSREHP